jgi:hypothetical protein
MLGWRDVGAVGPLPVRSDKLPDRELPYAAELGDGDRKALDRSGDDLCGIGPGVDQIDV